MPFAAANKSQVWPDLARAYLLQFFAIPGCVGPGGVTLVVVVVVVLLVDVADGGGTDVRVSLLGLRTQYCVKC